MSRSEVDALRKDGCLQLMEHLGEAQPRRGVLVLVLKSMIKELLFEKGGEQEKALLRKDEPEPTGRESTTATDSRFRESHERTPDQVDKGRPYATVDAVGLGLPDFGKHGAKDCCNSGRSSGGSTITLETQEILHVVEDAERIPGNKSGKQRVSRTDDKTHQTARGGKAIRGNASFERTRSETQDSQTERRQFKHSLGGGELAEGTSKEVDGASITADSVFARAWGGEFGRELCGMADASGETTMSTLSSSAAAWHRRHCENPPDELVG